jgi:hypothetical protein
MKIIREARGMCAPIRAINMMGRGGEGGEGGSGVGGSWEGFTKPGETPRTFLHLTKMGPF